MRDNCYIDGISTRSRFGVWVTKGGYSDLLTFPALVDPDKNDWPEEDGIEVDLSDPRLQGKDITVSFLAGTHVGATDFIAFVSKPGYHTLHVPSLGREWRIRLAAQPANKMFVTATSFSIKFIQDVPVRPLSVALPDPGLIVRDCGYELDGVPLADYGVVVDVARDEVLKAPAVKQNLSRKVRTQDGQVYDADHLVFSSKEVAFKCRLKAVSTTAFWECYDAFFAALIQPEERRLYVPVAGETYPCYYKKSSQFKVLSLRDPVIVEFSLTLVFTVFRIQETDYILATEAGEWIVTEDGEYLIDLNYGG